MPSRCLVTGGHGFAGRHLVEHLRETGHEVIAPSSREVDLLDSAAARAVVGEVEPDAVFHLAARASVAESWREPKGVLLENTSMTLSVLEAVREEAPTARVLVASSGEVYGAPESLPVVEGARLAPQNPYAVSKAATDLLAGLYADAHGLHVVRTRAFNHAGPGQADEYVVGTLTRQVAQAEADGRDSLVLQLGNVDSRRDFTDVRDVARAYALAVDLKPGIYNVASGRSRSIKEIIAVLNASSRLDVSYEVREERKRRNDVPEVRGSSARLRSEAGWKPEIPFERTLSDAIAAWSDQGSAR